MVRGASGRLLDAVRRLQESLWRFQGGLEWLQGVLERFQGGFGSSMGGEATAGRAPGRALETHYIEMSRSFCFELEIRQNVS